MFDTASIARLSVRSFVLPLARRMLNRPVVARLDPESLPEHLKRDLGLLGGRGTAPRDLLRD